MNLNNEELKKLVQQLQCYEEGPLDCDGCLAHIAEFAEAELKGKPMTQMLEAVRVHLNSCPCCRSEYEALLEALREIE